MGLHDELREAERIIEEERAILAEPALRKPIQQLERALRGFLQAAEPYRGLDWAGFLELRNALASARITKAGLADLNRRLQAHGHALEGSAKAHKENLALAAARSGVASEIARELRKTPATVQKERLYSLARAKRPAAEVAQLPDQELKTLLKTAGLKERKTRRQGKSVWDRKASEEDLVAQLEELRFRIGE